MFIKNEPAYTELEEYADTDLIVHKVDCGASSLIFATYVKLNSFEQHFHVIQGKYRILATTWLLASFMGIGYFLFTNHSFPLDTWICCILVAIGGIIGISTLWSLDLFVYQTILQAVIIEEIIMEKKYKFLNKVRTDMMKAKEKKEIGFFQGGFYIASNSILALLIFGFLFIECCDIDTVSFYIILISFSVSCYLLFYLIKKKTAYVHGFWKKFRKNRYSKVTEFSLD